MDQTAKKHRHHHSRRSFRKNNEPAIIALLIFAVIVVIGTVAFNAITYEREQEHTRLINNVTVGNISLYGLTVDEAVTLLDRHKDSLLPDTEITVKIAESTLTLTNADTGATLDVATIANEAYLHGRTGAENGSAKLNLDPNDYIKLDRILVRQELEAFIEPFDGVPVETSVTISGERPVLTIAPYEGEPSQILTVKIGTPKYLCHTESIINDIMSAHKNRKFEITGEYTFLEPKPVTADEIFESYCVKPVNASVDPETLILTRAVYGYGFDITQLQIRLDAAQWGETITVPLSRIVPTVTDDMLTGNQN